MKKQSSFFRVHPITFIYFLMALLAGYFKNYLVIFIIVLIHEMCHLLMAYFFHFKLESMTLFPFGAYLQIQYFGQYHLLKEGLVSIMGPLSHILIYAALLWCRPYISIAIFNYAVGFNRLMFLFNFLPIYPMDGSKLLLVVVAYLFPYRFALYIIGIISFLSLSILVCIYWMPETCLLFLFLIYQQFLYFKHVEDQYVKLLIYRDRFVHYQKIRFNHGYSIYRPYHNVYLKSKKSRKNRQM